MIIVDEYKNVFQTMLHPVNATKKAMSLVEALMYYLKAVLIPLAILVVEINSVEIFRFHTTVLILATLIYYFIPVILTYLIAIPIVLLIEAFILYFIGKKIGSFQGAWSDTFTGLVYGGTASISLSWVPIGLAYIVFAYGVTAPLGPALGLALIPIGSIISAVWGIIVALLAIANQNKTKWVKVLISGIVPAIIFWILGAELRLASLVLGF